MKGNKIERRKQGPGRNKGKYKKFKKNTRSGEKRRDEKSDDFKKPDRKDERPFQLYHRGLLSLLIWWIAPMPILLIPGGILLLFTAVPFIAARRSSRWVERRYAIEIAVIAAIFISLLEIYFIYLIAQEYARGTILEEMSGSSWDTTILVLIFILNLLFCVLGAATGSYKYYNNIEKKESKKKDPMKNRSAEDESRFSFN